MKLKSMSLLLGALISSTVFAAAETCFEFARVPVEIEGVADRPAIVTGRHETGSGRVVVFTQEIIPLNEEAQDALESLQAGQTVCLKGTRGYNSPAKFFAYAVSRR
jgi:hypothetical protein